MSQSGIEFANRWVAENIQPTVVAPDGALHPETGATLQRFLADAEDAGVSPSEIAEDMGDLEEFISAALDEATDTEIDRLAEED